jgi:hypothetical protein
VVIFSPNVELRLHKEWEFRYPPRQSAALFRNAAMRIKRHDHALIL